jgi:microcystin-dependent protein
MADPRTFFDYEADADKISNGFPIAFDYLEDEHVTVEVDGVENTNIELTTSTPVKVRILSGVTAGQNVRVRRKSQPDTNLVDFVNGSVLTESELDRAYLHNRYLAEEISELNDASLQLEQGGTQWDAKSLRIKNVDTPTATEDATNKTYVDNKVNQVSSGTPYPPTKWVFTGEAGANTTYTVTGAEVNGDTAYDVSIDGVVKEPTTDYTVDPDTDTLTIIPSLSSGERIVVIQRGFGVAVTGTVGSSQIQADAIDGSKIADDSIDSEHYVDGSIDTAHIADNAVTAAKISDTDAVFNVQSNGRVGIGAVATDDILEVAFNEDNSTETDYRNVKGIKIFNTNSTTGTLSALKLETGGSALGIIGERISADEMKLHFISETFDGNPNTILTLLSSGPVGIGTKTPNLSYKLDVVGDVNITGDYKVNGTSAITAVPTGTVSAFAGSAAPTGYVLCDGSEYNKVGTYAALFAVLGSTYNTGGETANHFRVPDLRGRVVAGLDSANNVLNETNSIDGTALGEVGGDDVHQLVVSEMPSHDHGGTDSQVKVAGSTLSIAASGTFNYGALPSEGGDGAHNNVQPTIILNYIIKY